MRIDKMFQYIPTIFSTRSYVPRAAFIKKHALFHRMGGGGLGGGGAGVLLKATACHVKSLLFSRSRYLGFNTRELEVACSTARISNPVWRVVSYKLDLNSILSRLSWPSFAYVLTYGLTPHIPHFLQTLFTHFQEFVL